MSILLGQRQGIFKALNSTSLPIRTILFKQRVKKKTDVSTVSVIIKVTVVVSNLYYHPLNPGRRVWGGDC